MTAKAKYSNDDGKNNSNNDDSGNNNKTRKKDSNYGHAQVAKHELQIQNLGNNFGGSKEATLQEIIGIRGPEVCLLRSI